MFSADMREKLLLDANHRNLNFLILVVIIHKTAYLKLCYTGINK